jgi:hypothetical protein
VSNFIDPVVAVAAACSFIQGPTPPSCLCIAAALQFSQQQGNRCRSVLSFVAKESVDLLIIGLYKNNSRRKGLALKGNALALASR